MSMDNMYQTSYKCRIRDRTNQQSTANTDFKALAYNKLYLVYSKSQPTSVLYRTAYPYTAMPSTTYQCSYWHNQFAAGDNHCKDTDVGIVNRAKQQKKNKNLDCVTNINSILGYIMKSASLAIASKQPSATKIVKKQVYGTRRQVHQFERVLLQNCCTSCTTHYAVAKGSGFVCLGAIL